MNNDTTLTDWRLIDTRTPEGRRALNIEIAKRIGITITYEKVDYPGYAEYWCFVLRSPIAPHVELLAPLTKAGEEWNEVTRFADDISEAIKLPLPGDRVFMELRRWDEGIASARVWDFPTLPHHSLFLDDETAALAWCKAWLTWDDEKRKAVQS